MKTKVLEELKPKAASLGFNDEELTTASENIAGGLKEDATTEEIAAAVDAAIPYLKLSQSAANRSIERFKTQFEKDHPTKTKEQEEAERKAKEEAERKKKEEEERLAKQEPEYFKKYREAMEKRFDALEKENERLKSEKQDSDFRKRAVTGLEGVDEDFYQMLLDSRKFKDNDDVDAFVADVKSKWEKLNEKFGKKPLASMRPPKTGTPAADQPSQEVKDRIERRKAQKKASPIRGLESK